MYIPILCIKLADAFDLWILSDFMFSIKVLFLDKNSLHTVYNVQSNWNLMIDSMIQKTIT